MISLWIWLFMLAMCVVRFRPSMLLLFQKQEAWACVKGSSAGITASAACPLAGRWSFWESFRWDWIWVFFSPSCDIWGCWRECSWQVLPLLCCMFLVSLRYLFHLQVILEHVTVIVILMIVFLSEVLNQKISMGFVGVWQYTAFIRLSFLGFMN